MPSKFSFRVSPTRVGKSNSSNSITKDNWPRSGLLVSNLGMRWAIARTRWRIVLPSIMAVLCVYLMLLAKREQPTLSGLGTGWEVPANVLNCIINGPGFYFRNLNPIPTPHVINEALGYNGDRLLGVVLLWFLVGWSIERRVNHQALDLHKPIQAATLFTLSALACGVLACTGIYVACGDQLRFTGLRLSVIAKYPLRTTASMVLATSAWLLGFSVYFGRRAFVAAKKSRTR